MSRILELLIIFVSMASTVFRFTSGLDPCTDESNREFVNKWFQSAYKIRQREFGITMSRYDVRRDRNIGTYAYAPSATVEETLRVERVRPDTQSKVETNNSVNSLTLFWKYECDVAAAANLLLDGSRKFYKMDARRCQVYIFMRRHRWDRQCEIRDNLTEHTNYTVQYKHIDDNDVPEDIATLVGNETLASLEEQICARVQDELYSARPNTKSTLPLPLTVKINDAVDKSLTRFRKNIENRHVENIELKNISFSTYVAYAGVSGYVDFTGGIVEYFSIPERVGDANAKVQANVYNITSAIAFRQIRVHFNRYHVRTLKGPFDGSICLIVRDLEIQVGRSGFFNRNVCNESVWLNITRISDLANQLSNFECGYTNMFNTRKWASRTQVDDVKDMLGLYLIPNLLQYGVADYTDYIHGPCMSNSSKVWRHAYSSQTNHRFI